MATTAWDVQECHGELWIVQRAASSRQRASRAGNRASWAGVDGQGQEVNMGGGLRKVWHHVDEAKVSDRHLEQLVDRREGQRRQQGMCDSGEVSYMHRGKCRRADGEVVAARAEEIPPVVKRRSIWHRASQSSSCRIYFDIFPKTPKTVTLK